MQTHIPIQSLFGTWYIYLHYLHLVDFYGFHVGKYTNPNGCYGCYGIGAHLPNSAGCGQSCCCNDGALNHGGHENGFRGDLPATGGPKVGPWTDPVFEWGKITTINGRKWIESKMDKSGVITLLIGVLTPFMTGKGSPCWTLLKYMYLGDTEFAWLKCWSVSCSSMFSIKEMTNILGMPECLTRHNNFTGVVIWPTKTMHHCNGNLSKLPYICIVWSPENW